MKERINRRLPSAAMLVAVIALIVAVGGGAYAATKLKKNAVKTKNIKNKAVTETKLADKAVSGAKLGDKAVGGAKLGDTIVVTADSAATVDSDGAQNGNVGPVAHTGVVTATCPAGSKLLTGGAKWKSGNDNLNRNLYIVESYPDGDSWKADGIVDFGAQGNAVLSAHAVCLK